MSRTRVAILMVLSFIAGGVSTFYGCPQPPAPSCHGCGPPVGTANTNNPNQMAQLVELAKGCTAEGKRVCWTQSGETSELYCCDL